MNCEQINNISRARLGIDLDDYTRDTDTEITILTLDTRIREIDFSSGSEADYKKFLEVFTRDNLLSNQSLVAGYYSRILNDGNLDLTSDIIFTNSARMEPEDDEFREIIIVHELCHLIERTGYRKVNIPISREDQLLGREIQNIAAKVADHLIGYDDLVHNEAFGSLLSYYIGLIDPNRKAQLLARSLQPNFLDDYTDKFQRVIESSGST